MIWDHQEMELVGRKRHSNWDGRNGGPGRDVFRDPVLRNCACVGDGMRKLIRVDTDNHRNQHNGSKNKFHTMENAAWSVTFGCEQLDQPLPKLIPYGNKSDGTDEHQQGQCRKDVAISPIRPSRYHYDIKQREDDQQKVSFLVPPKQIQK